MKEGEILKGPKPSFIFQFGKYDTFTICSSLGLFVVNSISLEEIFKSLIIKSLRFDEFIFMSSGISTTLYSSK